MPKKKSRKTGASLCDKRTLVVWASLVAAMTVVSGVLLLFQPNPLPPTTSMALTALDTSTQGLDQIFKTNPRIQKERWRAIVIHHSGTSSGNAESLAKYHDKLGYDGLGYHFVIGNGNGTGDGDLQVGYRWMRQIDGRHVVGTRHDEWYNSKAVGICLIGDGDKSKPTQQQIKQLTRLVTALQQKLGIESNSVVLRNAIGITGRTTSPGALFPATAFRSQLVELPR